MLCNPLLPCRGGLGWGVEKMILHGADIPADFVALSLPPPWGRARVGGLRAPGLDPSAVQVPNHGIRPPTLILPHTGGGDQTRNRRPFYNSSERNKIVTCDGVRPGAQGRLFNTPPEPSPTGGRENSQRPSNFRLIQPYWPMGPRWGSWFFFNDSTVHLLSFSLTHDLAKYVPSFCNKSCRARFSPDTSEKGQP